MLKKKTKKKGGMSPAQRIKINRTKSIKNIDLPVYEDNNFRVGIEIEVCTFQALNSLIFIDNILDKIKEFKKTNSLQEKGKISQSDMLRIFNCGIGMVCILDKVEVEKAKKILSRHKLRTFEVGSIVKGSLKEQIQYN